MKPILQILTLTLVFFFLGCKDKCKDIECFTQPGELIFNVVDITTGEYESATGFFNIMVQP